MQFGILALLTRVVNWHVICDVPWEASAFPYELELFFALCRPSNLLTDPLILMSWRKSLHMEIPRSITVHQQGGRMVAELIDREMLEEFHVDPHLGCSVMSCNSNFRFSWKSANRCFFCVPSLCIHLKLDSRNRKWLKRTQASRARYLEDPRSISAEESGLSGLNVHQWVTAFQPQNVVHEFDGKCGTD